MASERLPLLPGPASDHEPYMSDSYCVDFQRIPTERNHGPRPPKKWDAWEDSSRGIMETWCVISAINDMTLERLPLNNQTGHAV